MATIHSSRFWDLYFRNAFLTLVRDDLGYVGSTFARADLAGAPVGLVKDLHEEQVDIAYSQLRSYRYENDERFTRLAVLQTPIGEAFEAVLRQTYPYRDPAPFAKGRMAQLFAELSNIELMHDTVSLATVEQTAHWLVENYSPESSQLLAATAWFLGERRERSSSTPLVEVVSNAPFVPSATHQIHFSAIDAAMSALWKVNDKDSLRSLLELMHRSDDAGRRKIVPLFERLLSTTELLSLTRCGDDYFKVSFWEMQLEPVLAAGTVGWDRFDSDALFWELRYLSALRLMPTDTSTLRKLAEDVVQTVAAVARGRLQVEAQ